MSKQEKLTEKLLNPQSTMTWQELISLHRPHPGNELKAYVKRLVVEHLKEEGMI